MTPPPVVLEIQVDGHLDEHWAGWLGSAECARHEDGTTTFVVTVPDDAAVHAVLLGLRDIGATLLSMRRLTPPGGRSDGAARAVRAPRPTG